MNLTKFNDIPIGIYIVKINEVISIKNTASKREMYITFDNEKKIKTTIPKNKYVKDKNFFTENRILKIEIYNVGFNTDAYSMRVIEEIDKRCFFPKLIKLFWFWRFQSGNIK